MAYKKQAIPESTRRAVALRYGCEPGGDIEVPCHWCNAPGKIHWHRLYSGKPSAFVSFSHELDHLWPEYLGGTNGPDNIVLACRRCNRHRGHRLTTSSRQAHDILSESGSPNSRQAHDRKGREGKGRGSEELPTHPLVVTYPRADLGRMDDGAERRGGER